VIQIVLKFLPFRREFYKEYASWFGDAELNRHLGPMDNDWLECTLSEPKSSGITWAVFRGTELVGVVETKCDPTNQLPAAILAVAVKPGLRGQGIGSEIVGEILSRDHAKGLLEHVGYVSPENTGAQQFLEKSGFKRIGVDPSRSLYIEFRHRGESDRERERRIEMESPSARATELMLLVPHRFGARTTPQPRRSVVSACPDFS
jgi:ribosomal protein S18 acetylase RimI-like enzyme